MIRFQQGQFGDVFFLLRTGCGCKAGTIDVSDLNSPDRQAADCKVCGEGLTCPVMSSVDILLAGSSPNGQDFTPALEEGFPVAIGSNLEEMEFIMI